MRDLRASRAIAGDSKHLGKEIKFEGLHSGWILWLSGLGMIWLWGDSISVSPTFKGAEEESKLSSA